MKMVSVVIARGSAAEIMAESPDIARAMRQRMSPPQPQGIFSRWRKKPAKQPGEVWFSTSLMGKESHMTMHLTPSAGNFRIAD